MHLPLSRTIVPELEFLESVGSTNAELARRASEQQLPDFTVLVTTDQTAGKGRLGRVWVAPPGKTIAVSVLLTAPLPAERMGWLPLLAGLAMARAVQRLLPDRETRLKWPNDVQVDGLKVSGLLAEIVTSPGVVIGAGLNLTMTRDELPTEFATSLSLYGLDADGLIDRALSAYLDELRTLYDRFVELEGNPTELRAAVVVECATIGRPVRVELPSGDTLFATAVGIDEGGRLVVQDGDSVRSIAAGDVTHLRHA
jgi:BirA family biotin operon repressor/biotin-[acetyl-CoA-carboxylase] ligase